MPRVFVWFELIIALLYFVAKIFEVGLPVIPFSKETGDVFAPEEVQKRRSNPVPFLLLIFYFQFFENNKLLGAQSCCPARMDRLFYSQLTS